MKLENDIKYMQNSFEAPAGLLNKVLRRLEAEKNIAALRRRLFWAGVWLAASSTIFVLVARLFWHDAAASGFDQYAALVFTDFGFILGNWQEYVFSLLEALPALSAGVLLSAVLAMLFGFKLTLFFSREFKKNLRQAAALNR